MNTRCLPKAHCVVTFTGPFVCLFVVQTSHWRVQIQGRAAGGGSGDQQRVRVTGDGQAPEPAEEDGGRRRGQQELGQPLRGLPHRHRLSGHTKHTHM